MALPTFPWVDPADAPRIGATAGPRFVTEVSRMRSGKELRRVERPYAEHALTMDFSSMENAATKANSLYNFFCARKGRAEAFVVFDFDTARSYTDVRAGIATAAQTVIDLPSRNATSVTVKLDGTTKTGTFAALAGANGGDKFTLNVGAIGGEVITASFTGQRKYVVRFDTDELDITYLGNLLYGGLSIPLVERYGETG